MIKFAIIIPFRPKAESVDWTFESDLLSRTIGSLLQQTYFGIKIFVICSEEPRNKRIDERVTYVIFPYGHQAFEDIPNAMELAEKFKSEKMAVRRWDKARKLTYGCKLAKDWGGDYIMAMDADDLLSKHFFSELAARATHNKGPGWRLEAGFLYRSGDWFLLKVPQNMAGLNGSTHVLRSDFIKIPSFSSTKWEDYSLFTDHGFVKERVFLEYGIQLESIFKPVLIYSVHRSNISKVYQKEYGFNIKAIGKRLLRTVLLKKGYKNEFGIF